MISGILAVMVPYIVGTVLGMRFGYWQGYGNGVDGGVSGILGTISETDDYVRVVKNRNGTFTMLTLDMLTLEDAREKKEECLDADLYEKMLNTFKADNSLTGEEA